MKDLDWQILSELYRVHSVTKVAQGLYLTQPTVTKRLQNIEEEFGTQIVNRTPKGIEFTAAGSFLAHRAEEYIKFRRETDLGLKEVLAGSKETLRLGSAYTFSKYDLRSVLDPFTASHPGVSYEIVNKQSDILADMLLNGKLEGAFVRGDYGEKMNRVRLEPTPGYLVTRRRVDLSELPVMSRVRYQTGKSTMKILDQWWQEHFGDAKVREGVSAGYIDFALNSLVNDTDYLIMFLPASQLNKQQEQTGLHFEQIYHTDGTPVMRGTWFIYGGEKRISRTLEELVRYLSELGSN